MSEPLGSTARMAEARSGARLRTRRQDEPHDDGASGSGRSQVSAWSEATPEPDAQGMWSDAASAMLGEVGAEGSTAQGRHGAAEETTSRGGREDAEASSAGWRGGRRRAAAVAALGLVGCVTVAALGGYVFEDRLKGTGASADEAADAQASGVADDGRADSEAPRAGGQTRTADGGRPSAGEARASGRASAAGERRDGRPRAGDVGPTSAGDGRASGDAGAATKRGAEAGAAGEGSAWRVEEEAGDGGRGGAGAEGSQWVALEQVDGEAAARRRRIAAQARGLAEEPRILACLLGHVPMGVGRRTELIGSLVVAADGEVMRAKVRADELPAAARACVEAELVRTRFVAGPQARMKVPLRLEIL